MERKVVVNSNCFHGYSIEDAIDSIAEVGFKYIELTATKDWTEHVLPNMEFTYLCKVKERCEEKGLVPLALSGHCNLLDENRIGNFINNIKMAQFFGCKYIVTSIGEAHFGTNQEVSQENMVGNVVSLIPYLKKYNLQLVLEVHGKESGTGRVLKKLVEKIDSEIIGINYDTGNAIYYGGADIISDMESCVEYIKYMHLKDKDGEMTEWNFPALGTGKIEFEQVVNLMDKNNNMSPMSIEIEFTEKGSNNIQEVKNALYQSYEYLKKIGVKI